MIINPVGINIKNNIEHAWIYYGKSSQFDMEKSIDITLFEGTDYENDEKNYNENDYNDYE